MISRNAAQRLAITVPAGSFLIRATVLNTSSRSLGSASAYRMSVTIGVQS